MVSERITIASLENILGVDMEVVKNAHLFRATNLAGEQIGIDANTEEILINNVGIGVFVEDALSTWETAEEH